MPQLLEGTWEEITKHAEELKGRHLQVTVLDMPSSISETPQEESLVEVLDRIGTVDGPATDISEHAEDLWGKFVKEKHGKSPS